MRWKANVGQFSNRYKKRSEQMPIFLALLLFAAAAVIIIIVLDIE